MPKSSSPVRLVFLDHPWGDHLIPQPIVLPDAKAARAVLDAMVSIWPHGMTMHVKIENPRTAYVVRYAVDQDGYRKY